MVPPAPSLFSTTMVWPSDLLIEIATVRATTSVGPPAAKGTISVIGLVGKACAHAAPESPTATDATAANSRFLRINFIVSPPWIWARLLTQPSPRSRSGSGRDRGH